MKVLILSAILQEKEEVMDRIKPITPKEWPELRTWHQYHIKNWINAGHTVTALNFLEHGVTMINDYDLCLLLSGGTNFRRIPPLSKKEIPMFMYCEDTWEHYNRDLNYRDIFLRTQCDLALEPSIQNLEFWRKENFPVVWYPYAVDSDYYYPKNLPKESDIFFSGKGRTERLLCLDKLDSAGFKCDFHVFEAGSEYEKRFPPITQQIESKSGAFLPYLNQLNKAKIGLECSKQKEMAERPVEIMACKILCLCDRSPGMEKLFEDKKEIVYWDNLGDLYSKAKYYLEHDEEREAIADAGYKKIIEKHLFKHRIAFLVKLYNAIESENIEKS